MDCSYLCLLKTYIRQIRSMIKLQPFTEDRRLHVPRTDGIFLLMEDGSPPQVGRNNFEHLGAL